MSGTGTDLIIVSAVCVYNREGHLLTVRKRGTDKFMHPGGKPEPGETAAEAASRELFEEVGIEVAPGVLEPFGVWLAVAANEAATTIEATVFTAPGNVGGAPFGGNRGDSLAGPGRAAPHRPGTVADGPRHSAALGLQVERYRSGTASWATAVASANWVW